MQTLQASQTVAVSLTAEEWADRIRQHVTTSLEAILAAGQLLAQAKDALPRGEWCRLCEGGLLPFSRQTAFRLMAIATHPIFRNVAPVQHLPIGWSVLAELTKMPADTLQLLVDQGRITPATTRQEAIDLWRQTKTTPPAAITPPAWKNKTKAAMAERLERMRTMAADGASTRQIAAVVKMHETHVTKLLKQAGIDVPADKFVKGTKRFSAARILDQTVEAAEGVTTAVNLIDYDQLDADALRDAIQRLRKANRQIMAFVHQLQDAERMKTYAGSATVDSHSSQEATAPIQDLSSGTGTDACATGTGDAA